MSDNARRVVFFEEWMDTKSAIKTFDAVEDVQIQRLEYAGNKAENDAAMARAHGYQVQSRTELQEPWFPNDNLLARAPNLVAVSSTGAGYDYIDVAAMTAAGVAVVNQTGANREAVAEHALGMMLAVSKQIIQADRRLRREANVNRMEYTGVEMRGKTLGIVGIGMIGSRTAELCNLAFNMKVIAYDPHQSAEEIVAKGATKVGFNDLLAQSDFITVHCPRTEETLNMFGTEQFRAMKDTAVFVITARGGIVDEDALVAALKARDIVGAGVDVFWEEPTHPDHPLMKLDNVLLTPHHAGITKEANYNMSFGGAQQMIELLRGQVPPRLVNPEVWPAFQDRFERIVGFRPVDLPK